MISAAGISTTQCNDRGFTLLELLVVLGILAALVGTFTFGLRRIYKADLRADAIAIAAAIQTAFDHAAASGTHHRLVLDLDQETVQVEKCEGKIRLRRSDKETEGQDGEKTSQILTENLEQQRDAVMGAVSPQQCVGVRGPLGKPQPLHTARGIGIEKVYVTHLENGVEAGKAFLHFFPLGYGERAIIEIGDKRGTTLSILHYPLSGRARILENAWPEPLAFVHRDGGGEELGR